MKEKARRIMVFTLILILAFCALPLTATAASVSTESALRTNVAKGGSHKLSKDITLSSSLVVPAGKTVTLDLNGKTLSRSLTEAKEDGSVIYVEQGAELIITDTSTKREGTVTGGFSVKGGGICNYGKFTLMGGSIVGNSASDCGGGIYNAPDANLILSGGFVTYNRASKGGGVYNDEGWGTFNIVPSVQTLTVAGTQKQVECNVTMTANTADKGGAFYSFDDIGFSGAPELSGNNADADITLHHDYAPKLICGKLTYKSPVGVTFDGEKGKSGVLAGEITEKYGENNTEKPDRFFYAAESGFTLHSTIGIGNALDEIKLVSGNSKTVVEAFDHGKLIFSKEYDKPGDAWIASQAYWKQCYYYFEDELMRKSVDAYINNHPNYNNSQGFNLWYSDEWFNSFSYAYMVDNWPDKTMKQATGLKEGYDAYTKAGYRFWEGHLQDDYQVKITLGSDWKLNDRLLIWRFRNVIVDLNGHYIDRGGKKATNGMVFYLEEFSKLTIIDSNPGSDGYGDFKGGVVANGNGDDKGGGFVLDDYSELVVLGGTIYNCKTDDHGGAVTLGEPHAKLTLKNCTFDSCQTKDSGDDCNGGAIWIKHALSATMENVTFNRCSSEDNGGAIYITHRPGTVKMKNCTFFQNSAKDYGGAIQIKGIDNKKLFLFEAVGCTFYNNQADKDGGAVCFSNNDDSPFHYPTVFRDCSFERNISGADGSAFEVDDNSLSLINCTLTYNIARGHAAVYVNDGCSLSVGGKTVIKDNTGQDVILDDDKDKTRIYSTGLTAGSDIHVNVIGGDNTIALKDISKYEVKYFTAYGNHRLEYRQTGEKTANLTIASLFGEGSVWVVIGIAGAVVIAAVLIVFIKKGKDERRAKENA